MNDILGIMAGTIKTFFFCMVSTVPMDDGKQVICHIPFRPQ
jgi:hypothetical protein